MGGVGPNGPVPFNSPLIYNPYLRYECWRHLSYMFIHSGYYIECFHLLHTYQYCTFQYRYIDVLTLSFGITKDIWHLINIIIKWLMMWLELNRFIHLGTNLVVQIVLGIPLEMVHGWWRLLIIYLAGVTAGSLGTSVSDPTVYLAGASGGVYALLLAHLASLILVFSCRWSAFHFDIYQYLHMLYQHMLTFPCWELWLSFTLTELERNGICYFPVAVYCYSRWSGCWNCHLLPIYRRNWYQSIFQALHSFRYYLIILQV